ALPSPGGDARGPGPDPAEGRAARPRRPAGRPSGRGRANRLAAARGRAAFRSLPMRLSARWLVLLVVAVAAGRCDDRPKDQVPTKIEPAPKQEPQAGGEQGSP